MFFSRWTKIVNLFKKVFFPSFVYEFSSLSPDISYFEKANNNLNLLGVHVSSKGNDFLVFSISSSKMRKLSYGKLLIQIKKSKTTKYNFRIEFITHKSIFYFIAFLLSIFILVNAAMTASISKLAAIPFILLSGHIYFWGMLPSGVKKIKDFLIKLGEEKNSTVT